MGSDDGTGEYLLRITAPHYVAGAIVASYDHLEPGTVVRAAPILKWAIGRSVNVLLASCERLGYATETVVPLEEKKYLTTGTDTRYNSQSETGVKSMTIVKGVVAVNIESNFDDDRRIKLDKQPEWYSADPDLKSKLSVGNRVQIKVEGEGKNMTITKVKVDETGVSVSKGKGSGGKGGGGYGGGKSQMSKEEWAEKDRSIRYQHSQKVGVALADIAERMGLIPKKDAEKTLLAKFDQYTASVYSDIAGREALVRVNGETNEETAVDPDEDDGFDTDEDDDGFE